jgi:hypothetical protein
VSDSGAGVVVRTSNGGVHLQDIAGSVNAETTNGGVSGVSRIGGNWRVVTTNASITLGLAPTTSAHIAAVTTNGGIGGNVRWTYSNGGNSQGTARIGAGVYAVGLATTNADVTVNVGG